MYDTVKLWLPTDYADNLQYSRTLDKLSRVTEHYRDDGQSSISGSLSNCRVSISERGVSCFGSLAKYYLKDNFQTMTSLDTELAIEKMSDELHLPMKQAKVTRIDFAQNFLMKYEPKLYYQYLGDLKYYNRLPVENSLYYKNGLRHINFYDKVIEAKEKKIDIPEVWHGQNVLRYEIRFKKRLKEDFKQNEITASTLSETSFYSKVFNKWLTYFESIKKLKEINFNYSHTNSPKDFWKQIKLNYIGIIGQNKMMQEIENMRLRNTFANPEYYSKIKNQINQLCSEPKLTENSELMTELSKKIRISDRFYR